MAKSYIHCPNGHLSTSTPCKTCGYDPNGQDMKEALSPFLSVNNIFSAAISAAEKQG